MGLIAVVESSFRIKTWTFKSTEIEALQCRPAHRPLLCRRPIGPLGFISIVRMFTLLEVGQMDAIDILGSLLGGKAGSGGAAGNILKDILGGGGRTQAPPPANQHPRARKPTTISDAARSLEDLLNVSNEHHQQRREPASAPPSQPTQQQEAMNEQAAVLVRAMVSAAKSDGQITKDEQDKIIKQLGHATQETVDFLRAEFTKPVNVRDLAWDIPRGMEEQAYTVSLIAINLDEQKEANYLADLCQGLRLDPKRCNEIHRKFGAPVIFQA